MSKNDPRKPFHCLLSLEEYTMLNHLAAAEGVSNGHVMRSALRARFAMKVSRVPTCAAGNPCFVPHMHGQAAPYAPPQPVGAANHG